MGRNKYSADEIKQIAKLLRLKNVSNDVGDETTTLMLYFLYLPLSLCSIHLMLV